MLVVDGDALRAVDFLNAVEQIMLDSLKPFDLEQLLRVDVAFGEDLPLLDVAAFFDAGEQVLRGGDVVGDALLSPVLVLLGYYELALAVHLAKFDERAFLFGEDGDLLRAADFKELLDARETLRDVFSRELTDASGVEGAHRKLRAGFAYRLSGYDSDRLAYRDLLSRREVASVAHAADAVAQAAGQRAAHPDGGNAERLDVFRLLGAYLFVSLKYQFAGLGVPDVLEAYAAREALRHSDCDLAVLLEQRTDFDAMMRIAVFFCYDEVLCDVDEAARQVAGLSGT